MNDEVRISKHNYDEMMPNAPIRFQSLIAMAYCPTRNTHVDGGGFGLHRFLYFDDIIELMERKIKEQQSPMKYGGNNGGLRRAKLLKKWNRMLEIAMKNKNIQANKQKED